MGGINNHRQRQVIPVPVVEIADPKSGLLLGRSKTGWTILKSQQTLEQRKSSWHFTPTLNLDQRTMLVLSRFDLLSLQFLEPIQQRCLKRNFDTHRHGVDEWPNYAFDSRQISRTTCYDCAENNIVCLGLFAQNECPRSLD